MYKKLAIALAAIAAHYGAAEATVIYRTYEVGPDLGGQVIERYSGLGFTEYEFSNDTGELWAIGQDGGLYYNRDGFSTDWSAGIGNDVKDVTVESFGVVRALTTANEQYRAGPATGSTNGQFLDTFWSDLEFMSFDTGGYWGVFNDGSLRAGTCGGGAFTPLTAGVNIIDVTAIDPCRAFFITDDNLVYQAFAGSPINSFINASGSLTGWLDLEYDSDFGNLWALFTDGRVSFNVDGYTRNWATGMQGTATSITQLSFGRALVVTEEIISVDREDIPAPAPLALLGVGLLGLAATRRKKTR